MHDNYNTRLKNSLMVATFLGGISFGAVTFLIGLDTAKVPNQTTFSLLIISYTISTTAYKQFLIGGIGIGSTLLIVSAFFIKSIIVQNKGESDFSKIALGFYEAGFVVLLIFIPFIVAPFSIPQMVWIIIAIEITWVGLWIRNWRQEWNSINHNKEKR